ncbi:pentatricopeptide repeat-containing protein At3g60050-like [Papaver somniferum]|nr:pentatricopeptide repeat-containing protein At3g60050-like [Papaver somniferum]
MNLMVLFSRTNSMGISHYHRYVSRLFLCDASSSSFRNNNIDENASDITADDFRKSAKTSFGFDSDGQNVFEETLLGVSSYNDSDDDSEECLWSRRRPFSDIVVDVDRILRVLQQDRPSFDTILALDKLRLNVCSKIVREVLVKISKRFSASKVRCARLVYEFFMWSARQESYRHTSNEYNLAIKVCAECEMYSTIEELLDEMMKSGCRTTARTFNLVMYNSGNVRNARRLLLRFFNSKTFYCGPFRLSCNAILHSLLVMKQYKLIEWFYRRMRFEGHSPDTLTYNIILCTKIRLKKWGQFHDLHCEMIKNGFLPDLHTYNIILYMHGKADNKHLAIEVLNSMREEGCDPSVLHFTSLIYGLSRAGNLEACEFFLDEMIKIGCMPDVVCYTVLVTGYVVKGHLEKAQEMFDEMIVKGQLPNVFTYNSIIRGLCNAGKFCEAHSMLEKMEFKGCNPNFVVYRTLLISLRSAGRFSEADEILGLMVKKGFKRYKLYQSDRSRKS